MGQMASRSAASGLDCKKENTTHDRSRLVDSSVCVVRQAGESIGLLVSPLANLWESLNFLLQMPWYRRSTWGFRPEAPLA